MKILFILFIFTLALSSEEEEKLDSNYISNLNKIGRELITKDNEKSKELLDSAFEYSYKHTSHYWLAYTYQSMGLYHLANDSLIRASDYLELSARAFGDIKYFNDKAHTNLILADLMYSLGRYEEAVSVLKKSLKDREKLLNKNIHNVYFKLNENYYKYNKDSADYYLSLFDPQVALFDFKIEIEEAKKEKLKEESIIHNLTMELEIEKMKANFIIWTFSILIILLILALVIFIVKLYKARKIIYNLKQDIKS
jgi:tetratricopeptide (TPR) repeat protein